MNLVADAVPERVPEAPAEAALRDDVPGDLVELAARQAGSRRRNRRKVRLEDELVDLSVESRGLGARGASGRIPETGDEVAGEVAADAVQLHADVDENGFASVPDRVVRLVMAFCRVPADADNRRERLPLAAVDHHFPDDRSHLPFGHAGFERRGGLVPDFANQPFGGAELFRLFRRLDHPQRLEIPCQVDKLRVPGRGLREREIARVRDGIFDADVPANKLEAPDVAATQAGCHAMDHRHVAEVGVERHRRAPCGAGPDLEEPIVAIDSSQGANVRHARHHGLVQLPPPGNLNQLVNPHAPVSGPLRSFRWLHNHFSIVRCGISTFS